MKCRRTPVEAEVMQYEIGKGMEDGFELLSDVITKALQANKFAKLNHPVNLSPSF